MSQGAAEHARGPTEFNWDVMHRIDALRLRRTPAAGQLLPVVSDRFRVA